MTSQTSSSPNKNVRANIIHRAQELFFQFGASRVTMEEIASRLGISKKTLYKCFANKDELLEVVMENVHLTLMTLIQPLIATTFAAKNDEFLQNLSQLGEMMASIMSNTSTSPLMSDIERSYPLLWKRVEERRLTAMTSSLRSILQHGVERGMFRADMNYDVVVLVYLSALETISSTATLTALSLTAGEAYIIMIRTLFEGIFTDSGRDVALQFPLGKKA
jgi:AcrR family transcriptional regulator